MSQRSSRTARERIVLVTTSFPRFAGDASGHFVATEAQRLATAGADVHVVCAGGSPLEPPEARGGLTVHWAGGGGLFGWPGAMERARAAPWRALAVLSFLGGARSRLARLGRADRLVAHWMVPSGWPLLAGGDAPLEVVAHGADVRLLIALPRPMRRHIVGALLARGARLRFVAAALREALCTALDAPLAAAVRATSTVAPCAIEVGEPPPPSEREAQRRALGCDPGERLVAMVGRLVPGKRMGLGIEACAALAQPLTLAIVGDGPERTRLARRAQRLGVRVRFTGQLQRAEALAVIAAADVLLATSAAEAAPTAIREARALGVPVVSTPAGDTALWSEHDAGIAMSEPEPQALAEALARVLS